VRAECIGSYWAENSSGLALRSLSSSLFEELSTPDGISALTSPLLIKPFNSELVLVWIGDHLLGELFLVRVALLLGYFAGFDLQHIAHGSLLDEFGRYGRNS
jgi:hypothetical protein